MSGSSAAAMTNRARECGLDVFYCNPTLGDGNCWYRAIVEQIHRKSVYNRIPEGLRFTDVGLLRVQVLNYIRMNEKEFIVDDSLRVVVVVDEYCFEVV